MNKLLYIFIVFLIATNTILAQLPCHNDFIEPTNNCFDAPIICGLDTFCSYTMGLTGPQSVTLCNQWISLDNPDWISFIATSNRVTVTITPHICIPIMGGLGLQGAIVTACPPPPGGGTFQTLGNCQTQCTQNAFTIGTDGNFIVGQQYWIMLDGCSGSVCEYELIINQGSEIPYLEDPTEITGNTSICPGGTATFTVDNPSFATTFHWIVDGVVITSHSPELEYTIPTETPAGVYEICLLDAENACFGLVASQGYQSGSICYEFEVRPLPPITYTGSTTFCSGGQVRIDIIEQDYLNYQWSDLQTGNFAIFNQEGAYSLRVIDSFLCNNVLDIYIHESDSLTPSVVGITSFCPGDYAEFFAGPSYETYKWNGINGESSHRMYHSGELILHVQDQLGCAGTTTLYVHENDYPIIEQVQILDDTGESDGAIMVRFDRFKGGNYTYEWSNGANTPKITNLEAGEYTVTVTHPNGCQAVYTFEVQLNENFNFRNNELERFIFNSEPAWTSLHIYPNPFSEMTIIQVELLDNQNVDLFITDSYGRLIIHQHQKMGKGYQHFSIQNTDLPKPGIYYCTLAIDGIRITRQLIYIE